MLLYAGIMYVMGIVLLPIADSLHLELRAWSSHFMQDYAKMVAFFNLVSLVVLMILEASPFILFVLLSIGTFIGCILLVDKIFRSMGFVDSQNEYNDQKK